MEDGLDLDAGRGRRAPKVALLFGYNAVRGRDSAVEALRVSLQEVEGSGVTFT